jgi:DNA-binding transcriptional LysR family regulator
MHVSYRQLRLFAALADCGSVTGAARALHVTQPTASMQLKDMADAIGLPLYEVVGRKVIFTEVGHALAATARDMTATWGRFEQTVDGLKGLTRGTLKVAVVSTAKYFMPRLIGAFCERHPGIDISLEIHNRNGVLQRIHENLDDLYIMSQPPADAQLQDTVFMDNPLVLIAAVGDPLTRAGRIPLSSLAGRRFVLREVGSGTRMAGDQFFRAQHFRADVRLQLGSNEAIKEAVAGGLGLGVVSRHALHGLAGEHGVMAIDVEGFPICTYWHLVQRARTPLSPVACAFRQHLLATPTADFLPLDSSAARRSSSTAE